MHFISIPTAHGQEELFLWRTCTSCQSSEVEEIHSLTKLSYVLFVETKSQAMYNACLSGKGIGKALMSKVAQVSNIKHL